MSKGKLKPEDAIQATLSSLPNEVVDTVGVTALPSEDSVSERRRKLEYLEMQEELIKARKEDVALKEMNVPTAREAQEHAIVRALEKRDQLCQISCALAVLALASFVLNMHSVSREREEFLGLVNKEIELYNSMVDKKGTDGEKDAIKAYRVAREETDHSGEVSDSDEVSSVLIEKEIDDVDAKIGDRWRVPDRDHDGKVTPEEVATTTQYLKDTLGKEGVQDAMVVDGSSN
ncbi:hypothetical protein GOBAR_DD12061 [Gossypium barbadense]|nr:hypothetical protein GOBAR_DD12061 [Gossypium barbadense]